MSIVHVAFYPSDWLAGTRGLSAEETGVYITLLARIYEMAGPIERDDARLARLCGCKSRAAFVKALAYLIEEGKIVEREDGLSNERAEREIEKATEKSSLARRAAQSRWDKKSNKIKGRSMRTHSERICQPEPEPEVRDTDVSLTARDTFDDFWSVVPRKVAKGTAAKAWAKAVKKAPPETIIAAMRVYARSREGEDPTYTAHPATWLNAERWDDEPPPPSQPKRTATDERWNARMEAAAEFARMDSGQDRDVAGSLFSAERPHAGHKGADDGLDQGSSWPSPTGHLRVV